MKIYTYTVSGTIQPYNSFPFDCLRYDRAWPAEQVDACNMTSPLDDMVKVTVRLRSPQKPTDDRWKSFGWTVADVKVLPN